MCSNILLNIKLSDDAIQKIMIVFCKITNIILYGAGQCYKRICYKGLGSLVILHIMKY